MTSRYCFVTGNPDWLDIVRTVYKNLNVEIEQLTDDDICVTALDNNAEQKIHTRNAVLVKQENMSQPLLTPKWTYIINNGPYVTEDDVTRTNYTVKLISTGEEVALTTLGENALYAYDYQNTTPSYQQNFKNSFAYFTGVDFNDIDFTNLKPHNQSLEIPDKNVYGYVMIDNVRVPLLTYATPPTIVDSYGNIIPGITKSDIILNSSQPVEGYRTEYAPNTAWAAKWMTNWSVGRIFINFNTGNLDADPEVYEDTLSEHPENTRKVSFSLGAGSFSVSKQNKQYEENDDSDVSENSDVSQYADEEFNSNAYLSDDTENEYGDEEDEDIGANARAVYKKGFPLLNVPYHENEIFTLEEWGKPDYKNLTNYEKKYLPLIYVISQIAQWKIILNCLNSKFNIIIDLPKVNDYTLELIANSITYAISKGIPQQPAAIALLEYANERRI